MMAGSCVACTNPELALGSSFFPVLLLYTPLLVSLPFVLPGTGVAFLLGTLGSSAINPAGDDGSPLLAKPASKDENAPESRAAMSEGKPATPCRLEDDRGTCKTVATFTLWLTQLDRHPVCAALHTLTVLTLTQNWHKSRCGTFLPRRTLFYNALIG
jgi:hypothetical protein